jgi:hypothetical protein
MSFHMYSIVKNIRSDPSMLVMSLKKSMIVMSAREDSPLVKLDAMVVSYI